MPGILALAVMSTAFTGLAIGTGFERRYGVLKRLGASPLSRTGLIAAKTLTVLTVEAAQFVLVLGIGALLGWSPHATPAAVAWVPLLLLAGTAAFSGLALLMAGTLRAEATLAAANLLYIGLLGIGGLLFPLTKFPAAVQPVLKLLPSGALSDGLRSVLAHSGGFPAADLLVLCLLGSWRRSAWPRGHSAGSEGTRLSWRAGPRCRPRRRRCSSSPGSSRCRSEPGWPAGCSARSAPPA